VLFRSEIEFAKNVKKSITIATSNQVLAAKRKQLNEHNKAYLTPILKSLGASDDNILKFIKNETETILKPWNVYFYKYNPAIEFEKLKVPLLSLNGSKDTQVNQIVNQTAIRNALIKGNNKNYKVVRLENLNHLFQECKTGKISEYKNIEQTIAPIVLKEISNWILKTIKIK